MPLSKLLDELAVVDAIHRWCAAIDERDWTSLKALITDFIRIDYSSNGSVNGDLTADEWVNRLRVLHGFDATLHMVTNIRPSVEGDQAVCSSYVNAMHFLDEGQEELHAFACGTYVHQLARIDGRWRICAATFRLAGRHGGRAAFDAAFERARALAPGRERVS